MTTFKHPNGKAYRYDFWLKLPGDKESQRYTGNTGQVTKADADLVEAKIKIGLRREGAGIAPVDRMRTPSFTRWADVHLEYVKAHNKISGVDQFEGNIRKVLRFFGRRPQRPPSFDDVPSRYRDIERQREADAPYHDLRLLDPITDPEWVEKFERWMTTQGYSGARKNQLRSAASGFYATALRLAYRKRSGVMANPFENLERDDVVSRERTLSQPQLWTWIASAAPHARIAMSIAAYAPKLREGVILELDWKEHFDPDLTRIVVQRHKARRKTRRPQIVLIHPDLRSILKWWRDQHPRASHVVLYRDEPVTSLKTTLRAAVTRANLHLSPDQQLTYGAKDGVTFHTIRHTMATMLAELGVGEKLREAVMGQTQDTIQKYTHLVPTHEKQPMARLARKLKLVGAVQGPVGPLQGQGSTDDTNPQQIAPVFSGIRGRGKHRQAQ